VNPSSSNDGCRPLYKCLKFPSQSRRQRLLIRDTRLHPVGVERAAGAVVAEDDDARPRSGDIFELVDRPIRCILRAEPVVEEIDGPPRESRARCPHRRPSRSRRRPRYRRSPIRPAVRRRRVPRARTTGRPWRSPPRTSRRRSRPHRPCRGRGRAPHRPRSPRRFPSPRRPDHPRAEPRRQPVEVLTGPPCGGSSASYRSRVSSVSRSTPVSISNSLARSTA